MALFHMIFHISVILGATIQLIEAGLITPIGNMNSVAMFRPLLTTFRGNVNTGYIPNASVLPLRQPNARITYVNPVSPTPLGNRANSWFYVRPSITQGVMTPNGPWFPGSSPTSVFNVGTDTPNSVNPPDYDALLAEKFPGAVKLLEQLKKLNKIKDEQRKKALATKIYEENQGSTEVPLSYGHDDKNNNILPDNIRHELKQHGHEMTAIPSTVDGRLILKKITKKKFYHQAKPVRPVNEKTTTKDVVYFVD